jgi:hypothetical protein
MFVKIHLLPMEAAWSRPRPGVLALGLKSAPRAVQGGAWLPKVCKHGWLPALQTPPSLEPQTEVCWGVGWTGTGFELIALLTSLSCRRGTGDPLGSIHEEEVSVSRRKVNISHGITAKSI